MAAKERFSTRLGFLFATIGSAVGLGSIWKFPYEVGSNGGGAFVLFYFAGLALVVVPLMLAEFAVGRAGRADAPECFAVVAARAGASRAWAGIGGLGVVAAFSILSFYSVVGGWTLDHAVEVARIGLPGRDAAAARAAFAEKLADPWRLAAWHGAFMLVTIAVVAMGVEKGIEAVCRVLMPLLFVAILALAVFAMATGEAGKALAFLFLPDLARFGAGAALEAIGLGFFSIGVGLGLMVTYAAYAGEEVRLGEIAVAAVVADTLMSILAGLAIFPLVFAHGLDPAGGPGLLFETLPMAFSRMPGGVAVAFVFFTLVALSALASAMSMLEMVVAWVIRAFGMARPAAAGLAGLACWAMGLSTVLSFNRWADWRPLSALPGFSDANPYEIIDRLTSNVMLPAGGLLIAIFAGRVMERALLARELRLGPRGAWWLGSALRWLVPGVILAVVVGMAYRSN